MTALADALLSIIDRLEVLRTELRVLLTLVDEDGQARAHMATVGPSTLPTAITEREHEVLVLAGLGLTNKDIGERLHLVESTVKKCLSQSYRKLGLEPKRIGSNANRVLAVLKARELGMAPPEILSTAFRYSPPHISASDLKVGPNSRLDPVNPNNPFRHRPQADGKSR